MVHKEQLRFSKLMKSYEQTRYEGREKWNQEQQFPFFFVPSSNLAKVPSSFSELSPNCPSNYNL